MNKKRVLIVDDSAVVRQVLKGIVESDPQLEVMAAVADPIFAMRRMEKEWPDVITLDVEMPRMDGITFLNKLMKEKPTPVVMCSTLTAKGTEVCMEALNAGAFAIVEKPKLGGVQGIKECTQILLDSIKSAALANLSKQQGATVASKQVGREKCQKLNADVMLSYSPGSAMTQTTEQVIALGTSTGGTQALEYVLSELPRQTCGLVIVQHMPEKFTSAFAKRLNTLCDIEVREARNGDRVLPGVALIAPGGKHMLLQRNGAQYRVEIKEGPLVSRHRPSVDVLFRSVARNAGRNAMGVIMTGMGDDGAVGLGEMKSAGAKTLAQDETSCVVYGMPKEAVKRGSVEKSISLKEIPESIVDFSKNRVSHPGARVASP